MQQLSSKNRLSINNFTFEKDTCTISFFSTKTNKCWRKVFYLQSFRYFNILASKNLLSQTELNELKILCKNGNN